MSDAFVKSDLGAFVESPLRARGLGLGVTWVGPRAWEVYFFRVGWKSFAHIYRAAVHSPAHPLTRSESQARYRVYSGSFNVRRRQTLPYAEDSQVIGSFSYTADPRNEKIISSSLTISGQVLKSGGLYSSTEAHLVEWANNYLNLHTVGSAAMNSIISTGLWDGNDTGSATGGSGGSTHSVTWDFADAAVSSERHSSYNPTGEELLYDSTYNCTLSDLLPDEDLREYVQQLLDHEPTPGRKGLDAIADGHKVRTRWNHKVGDPSYRPTSGWPVLGAADIATGPADAVIVWTDYFNPSPWGYDADYGFQAAIADGDVLGTDNAINLFSHRWYVARPASVWVRQYPERLGRREWCVVLRETALNEDFTEASQSISSYAAPVTVDQDGRACSNFSLNNIWENSKRFELLTYVNMTPSGTSPNCTCV